MDARIEGVSAVLRSTFWISRPGTGMGIELGSEPEQRINLDVGTVTTFADPGSCICTVQADDFYTRLEAASAR